MLPRPRVCPARSDRGRHRRGAPAAGIWAGTLALVAVGAVPVTGLVGEEADPARDGASPAIEADDEPPRPTVPADGDAGRTAAGGPAPVRPQPPAREPRTVRAVPERPGRGPELVASADDAAAEAAEPEPTAERAGRDHWDDLADCESGDRDRDGEVIEGTARWDYGLTFAHEGYERFEGGLNFAPETWDAFRDPGMPDHAGEADRAQEVRVAERVLAAQGWGAWPVCSELLGLDGTS